MGMTTTPPVSSPQPQSSPFDGVTNIASPGVEGTSSAMVTAYKMMGQLSPLKDVSNHRGGASDAVMRGLSLEPSTRFGNCVEFVDSLTDPKVLPKFGVESLVKVGGVSFPLMGIEAGTFMMGALPNDEEAEDENEGRRMNKETIKEHYTGLCKVLDLMLEYESHVPGFETERRMGNILKKVEVYVTSGLVP